VRKAERPNTSRYEIIFCERQFFLNLLGFTEAHYLLQMICYHKTHHAKEFVCNHLVLAWKCCIHIIIF